MATRDASVCVAAYSFGLFWALPEQAIGVIAVPNKPSTIQIGRDARTGTFIPVREAERRPSTTVVERITRPMPSPVTRPAPVPIKRGK